jgi:CDP-4-dehydro-6-deoxyglucose reductase
VKPSLPDRDEAGCPEPAHPSFECVLRGRSGSPVQRLVLEAPPAFHFAAGQYLEVLHPEGAIPLSIASGPRRLPELHLHYRSTPGVREAAWMDELLESGKPLRMRGPFGNVTAPADPDVPLLLIAGGTGISQVCSILDELALTTARAPVTMLWCVDDAVELYCRAELEALDRTWLHAEWIVDPRRDAGNAGLRRIAAIAVAPARHASRVDWILLGGSPGFVYAALDVLEAAGVDPERVHSDVFAYAPRPARALAR